MSIYPLELDYGLFDFIARDFVAGPAIEICRAVLSCAAMFCTFIKRAAKFEISGDTGYPYRIATNVRIKPAGAARFWIMHQTSIPLQVCLNVF